MKTFSLAFLLNPLAVTALFECNKNQNEYTAVGGRFVVHYTSVRDEKYDGQPWVCPHLPSPFPSPTDLLHIDPHLPPQPRRHLR